MKKIIAFLVAIFMFSNIQVFASNIEIQPTFYSKSNAQDRLWVGSLQLVWNDFINKIEKEEPPKNTTFFFLTNNRENIISTIVSRSQIFKMPEKTDKSESIYINNLFKEYPNFNLAKAFEISNNLQKHIKENSISASSLITMLTNYFSSLLKANSNNKDFVKILKEDIKKIYKAEKMVKASMQTKNVIDWLLIELAR